MGRRHIGAGCTQGDRRRPEGLGIRLQVSGACT